MGNFYTNIVLRESDLDRISSAVEALERRAYVASDGKITVVFDERCDKQDLEELERLARQLSRKLACAAVAFCNHDDDVLWYALVERGKTVDVYESDPGYFSAGDGEPRGGDAVQLCRAFGAEGRAAEIDALLRKDRKDVVFEIERHRELLELLAIPADLGLMGYGYVRDGELKRRDGIEVRAVDGVVGGADETEAEAETQGALAVPSIDPKLFAAMKAETADWMPNTIALALSRVEVRDQFMPLVKTRSTSGYAVMMRLHQYIVAHNLLSTAGMVQADDLLAELLGEREFLILALGRLVMRAFRIPSVTADELKAFQRGDPELQRRYSEGLRDTLGEMS